MRIAQNENNNFFDTVVVQSDRAVHRGSLKGLIRTKGIIITKDVGHVYKAFEDKGAMRDTLAGMTGCHEPESTVITPGRGPSINYLHYTFVINNTRIRLWGCAWVDGGRGSRIVGGNGRIIIAGFKSWAEEYREFEI